MLFYWYSNWICWRLGNPFSQIVFENNEFDLIPAKKVKAVDTTAAGDVFNGALAVAISERKDIKEAVRFANAAAAISVTKLGAQASAPFRQEVDKFFGLHQQQFSRSIQ